MRYKSDDWSKILLLLSIIFFSIQSTLWKIKAGRLEGGSWIDLFGIFVTPARVFTWRVKIQELFSVMPWGRITIICAYLYATHGQLLTWRRIVNREFRFSRRIKKRWKVSCAGVGHVPWQVEMIDVRDTLKGINKERVRPHGFFLLFIPYSFFAPFSLLSFTMSRARAPFIVARGRILASLNLRRASHTHTWAMWIIAVTDSSMRIHDPWRFFEGGIYFNI